MLFNSFEFIFFFLPFVYIIYFTLNSRHHIISAKLFLIGASLFFYGWWNIIYLPILFGSILINYYIGRLIHILKNTNQSRLVMLTGISANVLLLGYFKYTDFLITNINSVLDVEISLRDIALPLAISFFTFQQIAYLVDSYRGETKEYNFLNYTLFISFFPQLIAGPIVHHKEMIPQFLQGHNRVRDYRNSSIGLFIFFLGLFKKVVLADTFAFWANSGFADSESLSFVESWITSLSYTFQIYFDFSGYTDMAIGAALLFNIKLPINFNSPYKARNIQDFWRRWHITLSRFLRDYIYIPLGGNRNGYYTTYLNLGITFFLGGLWHGASWTFVIWGLLHGSALIFYNIWSRLGIKLNFIIAWILTFNFINVTWIFFRSENFTQAIDVLTAMFGIKPFTIHFYLEQKLAFLHSLGVEFRMWSVIEESKKFVLFFIVALVVIGLKNSMQLMSDFKPNIKYGIMTLFLMLLSLLNLTQFSDFLYFNF